MNRLQWALATMLMLGAQCVFADSIPTFDVTTAIVDLGIEGQMGFSLTGPGIQLFGGGVLLARTGAGKVTFSRLEVGRR